MKKPRKDTATSIMLHLETLQQPSQLTLREDNVWTTSCSQCVLCSVLLPTVGGVRKVRNGSSVFSTDLIQTIYKFHHDFCFISFHTGFTHTYLPSFAFTYIVHKFISYSIMQFLHHFCGNVYTLINTKQNHMQAINCNFFWHILYRSLPLYS